LLDAAVELMGESGRGGTILVQGRSMLPFLAEGQLLAVEFTAERWVTGDLLLFRQVDYLVVHRLIGRGSRQGASYYRCRGDGLSGFDPPVDPERVVGRVVAVRCGEAWRSVRSAGARRYARLSAWHDLSWTTLRRLAGFVEGRLRRLGLNLTLRERVTALDHRLLRIAHRLLFERVHPVVPAPMVAGAGRPAAVRD
jgi:hypothetical protein